MTIWCFAEEGEIELCEAELGTLDQRYRTTYMYTVCKKYYSDSDFTIWTLPVRMLQGRTCFPSRPSTSRACSGGCSRTTTRSRHRNPTQLLLLPNEKTVGPTSSADDTTPLLRTVTHLILFITQSLERSVQMQSAFQCFDSWEAYRGSFVIVIL